MGMKASMLLMLVLTVLAALALGWRETRRADVATAKLGWVARQKRRANRWVTAAAIAAICTLALLGGTQWLRVWLQ